MYSNDLSKKVKTAKKTKRQQGEFANALTIFGYKKNPTDSKSILVDEEAAVIVSKIFSLAIGKRSTRLVANMLNKECVPTPAIYRRKLRKWNTVNEENIWTHQTVLRILRDERYTGTFIGGYWDKQKVGSDNSVRTPKDKWIVIQDAFVAIVSKETFQLANEAIRNAQRKSVDYGADRILFKKVKCGECGHVLQRKASQTPYYFCATASYTSVHGCNKERIMEQNVLDVVYTSIHTLAQVFLERESIMAVRLAEKNQMALDMQGSIAENMKELTTLQNNKRKLYEQYKQNKYTRDEYISEREAIEEEIERLGVEKEKQIALLSSQKNETVMLSDSFKNIKNLSLIGELTRELADTLVDTVKIYGNGSMEIVFSFYNEYERVLNFTST